jgi:hypothetical protein
MQLLPTKVPTPPGVKSSGFVVPPHRIGNFEMNLPIMWAAYATPHVLLDDLTFKQTRRFQANFRVARHPLRIQKVLIGSRANLGRETAHELAIRGPQRTIGPKDTNGESFWN